jgi:hypothetical protein
MLPRDSPAATFQKKTEIEQQTTNLEYAWFTAHFITIPPAHTLCRKIPKTIPIGCNHMYLFTWLQSYLPAAEAVAIIPTAEAVPIIPTYCRGSGL